ncbi:MAG: metallophosphoesterase [Bdellovibrionales bacterium]|nr:metallophosphoesterase [Bdellovibrionales bacterium]
MRTRQILPSLIIFVSTLSLIHYFIFAITAMDLPEALHPLLIALMMAGLISIPVGLLGSHGSWRQRLRPLTYFAYFWVGFFFLTFSFVLVQAVILLFVDHEYSYWPWIAAILACIWSIFQALKPPRIVSYELDGPAAMKDLTLVQISDLHIGIPFLNTKWLAQQVSRINELRPDFVAITGDLADGPFQQVAPALEPLASLKPLQKKFYVTGNHEFIRGGDWETRLTELGFTILHNTHEIFENAGGKFLIAGVPDRVILSRGSQFESSPSKALASNESVDYKILLAHEPRSIFHLGRETCDLLLSGHTHGGQIFPFALLVRLAQPVVRGFKKMNGVLVFAHMGTGFWGPPMRWLTRSEIVVFRWRTRSF